MQAWHQVVSIRCSWLRYWDSISPCLFLCCGRLSPELWAKMSTNIFYPFPHQLACFMSPLLYKDTTWPSYSGLFMPLEARTRGSSIHWHKGVGLPLMSLVSLQLSLHPTLYQAASKCTLFPQVPHAPGTVGDCWPCLEVIAFFRESGHRCLGTRHSLWCIEVRGVKMYMYYGKPSGGHSL